MADPNDWLALLRQMSEELKLEYWEDDWGLINSDPSRVAEFTNYFQEHIDMVPPACRDMFIYEMTELIVLSLFDLCQQREPSSELAEDVRAFWRRVQFHPAADLARAGLRCPPSSPIDAIADARVLAALGEG